MRTSIAPIILVAIGLSLLIVGMSGLAGVLGVSDTGEHRVDEHINETGSQEPEIEGSAVGESPDAIQFMVGALQTFAGIVAGLFLLPMTLNNWLPWYSAYPLGLGIQILGIVGISQIAGGPWR